MLVQSRINYLISQKYLNVQDLLTKGRMRLGPGAMKRVGKQQADMLEGYLQYAFYGNGSGAEAYAKTNLQQTRKLIQDLARTRIEEVVDHKLKNFDFGKSMMSSMTEEERKKQLVSLQDKANEKKNQEWIYLDTIKNKYVQTVIQAQEKLESLQAQNNDQDLSDLLERINHLHQNLEQLIIQLEKDRKNDIRAVVKEGKSKSYISLNSGSVQLVDLPKRIKDTADRKELGNSIMKLYNDVMQEYYEIDLFLHMPSYGKVFGETFETALGVFGSPDILNNTVDDITSSITQAFTKKINVVGDKPVGHDSFYYKTRLQDRQLLDKIEKKNNMHIPEYYTFGSEMTGVQYKIDRSAMKIINNANNESRSQKLDVTMTIPNPTDNSLLNFRVSAKNWGNILDDNHGFGDVSLLNAMIRSVGIDAVMAYGLQAEYGRRSSSKDYVYRQYNNAHIYAKVCIILDTVQGYSQRSGFVDTLVINNRASRQVLVFSLSELLTILQKETSSITSENDASQDLFEVSGYDSSEVHDQLSSAIVKITKNGRRTYSRNVESNIIRAINNIRGELKGIQLLSLYHKTINQKI